MPGAAETEVINRTATISLSLPVGYGISPLDLIRLIQQADQVALAGVAVGELTSTDAIALVAAAASVTKQIRLETSVLSVLTRSPALFAMSAATMANLSGNRFVLGVGAGSPIVAGYHGVEFRATLARVEQCTSEKQADERSSKVAFPVDVAAGTRMFCLPLPHDDAGSIVSLNGCSLTRTRGGPSSVSCRSKS
jgi:Luciferase-like monooxygenase